MNENMLMVIMIFKMVGALGFGIMAYIAGRKAVEEDSFGLGILCFAFIFLAGTCVMYGSKELPVSLDYLGVRQVEQVQEVEQYNIPFHIISPIIVYKVRYHPGWHNYTQSASGPGLHGLALLQKHPITCTIAVIRVSK